MLDDKYIALLDDYLEGNLSQDESEKLLAEVESNPELKELLGILSLTRDSIRQSGYKQTIKEIHKEFSQDQISSPSESKVVKFKPYGWWLGIAASLTLIMIAGNYWVQSLPQTLYEDKYMAYEIPTMRSSGEAEEKLEQDFKSKNWQSVTESVSIDEKNRKHLFLAAVSYVELEDYSSALVYLKKLDEINLTESEQLFEDEEDYYTFLSHLKSGNYSQANLILEKITADPSHIYHGSFDKKDKIKVKVLELFNP